MDEFMQVALEEAQASGREGGFPVGSVIVRDGAIIGRGRNRFTQSGDPTTHAELEAIRDATVGVGGARSADALEGATCYTTMMPCEMCTGALIRFGIAAVVVAECESYIDAGTAPLFEKQGISVQIGSEQQCIDVVNAYLTEHPEVASRLGDNRRKLKL